MKLTKIIKPAKAITPSMTKTLKKQIMIKSDMIILDNVTEMIDKIKNVIISNNRIVIRSHSEDIKNKLHKVNQIKNISRTIEIMNEKDLEVLYIGM